MHPELSDFEGHWRLAREIEDRRDQMSGHLEGEAVFTPDAQGLVYAETGQLSLGGQTPMAAVRRYLWRTTQAGIAVFFEDGKPFHEIVLDRSMPDANHHCDPDLYHVSYDFSRWPVWTSVWRVVGPRKDYRMTSHYARLE